MREHYFRGKAEKDSKWLYGDLLQRKEFAVDRKSKIYRTYIRGTKYGIDQYGETYEHIFEYDVDPETVGEYIGLPDKKAKCIFEGDIVNWKFSYTTKHLVENSYIGKVTWDRNTGSFAYAIPGEASYFGFNRAYWTEYEVIGNVYDNPELLEEKHNVRNTKH